jgi:hypothetical protein
MQAREREPSTKPVTNMARQEKVRGRSKRVFLSLASLSLEGLLPLSNRLATNFWRVARRVTARRVARQANCSVRE